MRERNIAKNLERFANFTLSLMGFHYAPFRISAMPLLSGPLKCCCTLLILPLSYLALAQTKASDLPITSPSNQPPQATQTANTPLASFKDTAEKTGINFEIVSGEKDVKK